MLGDQGALLGVLTRRDLFNPKHADEVTLDTLLHRPPLVVGADHSLREAADHMVEAGVGRLIVVDERHPSEMLGIITRGDLLAAHAQRLRSARHATRHFRFRESSP